MQNLIITLLATSSVDSLNPIGITQQFVLQGMVKKPRHIWYFILTTAVVNIIFGYLVYYGVIKLMDMFWSFLLSKYAYIIFSLEMLFGIALFLISLFWLIRKNILIKQNTPTNCDNQMAYETNFKTKIKHITPLSLINIGIISTVSELTSAVPYFAFLSVLVTYKFSFSILTLVLICYNIIYIAPFVLLYVVYISSKKNFDKIYIFFREKCDVILKYAIPMMLLIIAAILINNSIANIMSI